MTVQEYMEVSFFGVHISHKPAKAIGPLLPRPIAKGCLSVLRHSKNESAGMRQRRFAVHAPRYAGFSSMPSARALKVENFPISFDQEGTNPQRMSAILRFVLWGLVSRWTTGMFVVGAILTVPVQVFFAAGSEPMFEKTLYIFCMSLDDILLVNRPHMRGE